MTDHPNSMNPRGGPPWRDISKLNGGTIMADTRSRDQWLRLQAVQVIAMLPEDTEEARRILWPMPAAYSMTSLPKRTGSFSGTCL